jgi:hypothetical protein
MKNLKLYLKYSLIVLLVGCLLPMPYGYFQLVRITVTLVSVYIAYSSIQSLMNLFWLGIAILFNPVFKIYLSRTTWVFIDVIAAIVIAITLIFDFKSKQKNNS